MKFCKRCRQDKPLSEFGKVRPKKSGGYTCTALCNKCHRAKYAETYSAAQKARIAKKRETVPDGRTLNTGPRGPRVLSKECTICRETKDRSQFPTPRSVCAECMPEWNRQRNKTYREYYYKRNRMYQSLLSAMPGSHTAGEWEQIKASHNYCCAICQMPEPDIELTRDHIVPITKGGSDYIENIQPLCRSCNSRKGNRV